MVQIEPKYSAKENTQKDIGLIKEFLNQTSTQPLSRIYEWQSNSCSIGISQDLCKIKPQYPHIKEQNFTKRITGGGILFHGHDISYSVVFGIDKFKNKSVKASYEHICSFLFAFYNAFDIEVDFAYKNKTINLSHSNFCQMGFEPHDILIDGKKIGGNAQKRTKDYIFMQGSIPLVANTYQTKYGGYSLSNFIAKPISPTKAKNTLSLCIQDYIKSLS